MGRNIGEGDVIGDMYRAPPCGPCMFECFLFVFFQFRVGGVAPRRTICARRSPPRPFGKSLFVLLGIPYHCHHPGPLPPSCQTACLHMLICRQFPSLHGMSSLSAPSSSRTRRDVPSFRSHSSRVRGSLPTSRRVWIIMPSMGAPLCQAFSSRGALPPALGATPSWTCSTAIQSNPCLCGSV